MNFHPEIRSKERSCSIGLSENLQWLVMDLLFEEADSLVLYFLTTFIKCRSTKLLIFLIAFFNSFFYIISDVIGNLNDLNYESDN